MQDLHCNILARVFPNMGLHVLVKDDLITL